MKLICAQCILKNPPQQREDPTFVSSLDEPISIYHGKALCLRHFLAECKYYPEY